MKELLIKNALVPRGDYRHMEPADVAVDGGLIEGIGRFDREEYQTVIDASGCILSPGLIDMHVHIYPLLPTGIPAEAVCFSTGVTSAVDAGSSGCGTYPFFRQYLQISKLRTKVFLNVATAGIISHPAPEDVDPAHFDPVRIRDTVQSCGEVMGLKIRTSAPIVRDFGLRPLEKTLELAEQLGLPVMVHPTDPPCPMADILERLRPGDILAHVYHNIGPSIIDQSGHVCRAAWEARERGVLFDAANDRQHFGLSTAQAAIADGFYPDIITSDLTGLDMFKHPTVFSLPMLASRYLALGLELDDILAAMTKVPAELMGLGGVTGELKAGLCADLAVFRLLDREVEFGDRPYHDPKGRYFKGDKVLKPMLTVRGGVTVFRDCEI